MRIRIARYCMATALLALALGAHAVVQVKDDRYPNAPSGRSTMPGAGSYTDEFVAGGLEDRNHGVIYIDAVATTTQACSNVTIFVSRVGESSWHRTAIPAARSFLGVQNAKGGYAVLEPGEYNVARVDCVDFGSRVHMIGPFARFHVKAGEVVNVGTLTLVRGRDASGKAWVVGASVGGMRPEVRAAHRKDNPKTAARMIERHMTVVWAGR